MLFLAAAVLGSYLLGSIPTGYLAGRVAGIDIKKVGSGNIGATNVTRVLGRRYGYPVFVIDFLKGSAAVTSSLCLGRVAQPLAASPQLFGIIGAASCVIGHAFPVWLRFRGGKGVATSAGALFALMPVAALIGAVIWIVTFMVTRYVSVASMAATMALPVVIFIMIRGSASGRDELFYFSLALAFLVILLHRSNLSRLLHGTEPRFQKRR